MIRETRETTRKGSEVDLVFKDESYAIIGACFAVYKDKGCGFHEPVYQECLGIELEHCKIPAFAMPGLSLEYRGRVLTQKFYPDYICFGKIVVELKAVSVLNDEHRAQVLNYLKASTFQLGLLVNFGHYPKLQYERIANTKRAPEVDEPVYL
ncbi:MAG TPA: GxxExxY protein [Chthoniobacterales bacterium]|nr:GxxExxY protein [Chthoniobacterales bacterium]